MAVGSTIVFDRASMYKSAINMKKGVSENLHGQRFRDKFRQGFHVDSASGL
jgi:hypothetical protein